jgi:oligopeptide transport system substrate-binding protein
VQAIIEQLTSALDYAHAREFVHRDIKPSNIIVADDGEATLTDFGLVKAGEGTQLTASGMVFGTPEYMSPEQAEGKVLDARSDVYSLGVVLFAMLVGRAPFVADTTPAVMYKHVHEPPPLEELPSDLPQGVVAVVEKALAKEREERYQSVGEIAAALHQAVSEAVVEEVKAPPEPVLHPSLTLQLSAKPTTVDVGGEAKWTVTLHNDGDDDLRHVTVRRGRTLLDEPFDLAAGKGQRFTFTTTYRMEGKKTEEVTATGIASTGQSVRDEARATVEVIPVPPEPEAPVPPPVVREPVAEKVPPLVEPVAVAKEEPRPPTVRPAPKAAPKKALRVGALVAGGLVLLCCMVGVIIRAIWPSPTPTPEVVGKVVKEPVVIEEVEGTKEVEVEKLVVLNANLGREPSTLDPALATDTTSVFCDKQLFLGLTAFYPETSDIIPELAAGWSVSDDGLVWTFKMRDDVKWVNYNVQTKEVKEVGPVTAHDIVYGVKRTLDPETPSDYAYVLHIIKGAGAANWGDGSLDDVGVKAVDDYTVEFTLEQPAGYFPAIASLGVARPQPKEAIETYGEKWTEPGNIVTNGPYMLESWEHEASMIMVKNPKYYDAANVQIERIELAMVQEDLTEMAMYENNELDAIGADLGWGPPLEDMDRIKADPVLSKELKITPRLCTFFYGFVNTKPPFDNSLVRKAFSASIDRQSLIDNVTRGYQLPAKHFAPPGVFGAPPVDEVGIEYDPERAKMWLAEAGYPDGEGLGEIILMHNVGEAHAAIAQAVVTMWEETLNVDVKIETREWEVYLQTLDKDTPVEDVPHIFRMGWCADYPDENNWVHQVFNSSAWSNRVRRGCVDPNCEEVQPTQFDELTVQAAEEPDPEKRKELYREAERILIEEETALAPIYHFTFITMSKPWVTVRYDSPMGGSPIKDWRIDFEAKAAATGR